MSFKSIGDYVELQRGTTYKSALLDQEGPYLLGLGSIDRDGGFRGEKLRTYGGPSADKLLVYPGDMYVSLKDVTQSGDLLGSVARVPSNIKVGRMTQDTVKLCFKSDISKEYFYWVLRSPQYRQHCRSHATGTTNLGLSRDDFFSFMVPELTIQREKITSVLEGIESKISLNKQINQTLEQMAQAIFKSWFVDFDPVKAKMSGEQPEGMDEATASLFPEKLVESELGLIPDGWSVEEAKSQLDVLRGFSYKGKGLVGSLDEGVPMHNLNSVLEGGGYKYAGLKFYSEEFKEKFAIQEGDVLVANTEQGHNHLLIGYGAMVPKHLAHGFFSHHTYRVRPKKNSNMTPEFIERLFGKGRFVRQVQGFTNGTTVNMLPTAGMEMPQFVVPPKALAQKFSELVKPMKAMIEENHKSNIELAKLRDTLLPKLLSGEIELAEKAES